MPWHCSSIHVSFAFFVPFLLAGWLFYKVLHLPSYSSFASVLSCCCTGLLCWSVFIKDVVGCFCHASVKAVDQSIYFRVLIFKGKERSKLSSYSCSRNISAILGSLSFCSLNPILTLPCFFAVVVCLFICLFVFCFVLFCFVFPLEAESEGHNYKLMVTFKIGS